MRIQMRKLATVEKIKSIHEHSNADNLEIATVRNWKVVVQKGEFQEGDNCVYFEIDSFLPIRPEFEFLRKSSYRKIDNVEGFRIKSIRLRNVLSQGLLIPAAKLKMENVDFGTDVTEMLGVTLYEPPISKAPDILGKFPVEYVSKTDEERIQNLEWEEILSHSPYEVTEKLDGSSCTIIYDKKLKVCSRNWEIKEGENSFWKIAERYLLKSMLPLLGRNWIAIQGELIGTKIQGNRYKLSNVDFYGFNVQADGYDKDVLRDGFYFNQLKMKTVPVIHSSLSVDDLSVDDIITMADGKSMLADVNREGLVFRSIKNPKFSFKAISNKFLLKSS